MGAHYAHQHHGVSGPDPAAVNEALDTGHPPATTRRYRNWGRIKYVDEPIRVDFTGTFADQPSLDQAIEAFLDTLWKISRLHMTKNTDWAYETELRIAMVELGLDEHGRDTAVYIPLRNCLKAVIFGDAHPAPRLVANGIQGALGADSPEFFQCHWIDGAPALTPLTN
jgi:hypothetical protein